MTPEELSRTGCRTLLDILDWRTSETPGRTAFIELDSRGHEVEVLSYRALQSVARRFAHALIAGPDGQLARGDRVLLVMAGRLSFLAAFFGCLYARLVPVPCAAPQKGRPLRKLRAIARNCKARTVVTDPALLAQLTEDFRAEPTLAALELRVLELGAPDMPDASGALDGPALPSDIAFLQYTSGSTSDPKGVVLQHSNLMANQRMIRQAMEHDSDSTFVGWAPLYHDQGLIGNVLQPLYIGSLSVLMAPMSFARRPLLWLEAISKYRAKTSGGPDFAFALCVRRTKPENLEALDLSCWDVAYNGADRIHRRTLERFFETFACCGFRREAFFNCYGLAEATLLVSGGPKAAEPLFQRVDRQRLGTGQDGNLASGDESDSMVACGASVTEQRILIVDPATSLPVATGRVGEIWVSGANVARAYWNNPRASEALNARIAGPGALDADADGSEALEERFLRTGDLGFLRSDGQLFVTGRIKELIIVEGRNLYPQDIEMTVQDTEVGFVLSAGAAVSYFDDDRQVVAVVQEVRSPPQGALAERHVANLIRRVVAEAHDIMVHRVVLVRKGSLPKTSSGKLQRGLVLRQLLAAELVLWSSPDQLPVALEEPTAIRGT